MAGGALEGLRVLDLSTLFAAPQIAAMLGDLGADVVKVEPPGGDPLRAMGADAGPSPVWAFVGRNKRSVVLDASTEAGRARLHRLIGAADVVVENLPRPVLERWHCTYDELAARNPRLVVVSVSAYGTSGPYAGRPGAGTLAEAFGGLTHLTGEPDGPPMLSSVPIGDTVTAFAGVIGVLAACYRRDARGGTGQHVDVSMYEPILQLVGSSLARHDAATEPPRRSGSRVAGGVPRNVYETRDREWVAVSGTTDAQVARLLPRLGLDADADRARFGTAAARLAAADELDALVARWVAGRDRDDVLGQLLDARIPAAPVQDLAAILADPQVVARASVVTVVDDALGPLTLPAPIPRLSGTPATVRTTGPALGAHTDEVVAEWLDAGS